MGRPRMTAEQKAAKLAAKETANTQTPPIENNPNQMQLPIDGEQPPAQASSNNGNGEPPQPPTPPSEPPAEMPMGNDGDNSNIIKALGGEADKVGEKPNVFEGDRILRDYSKQPTNNLTDKDFLEPDFTLPSSITAQKPVNKPNVENLIADAAADSNKDAFNNNPNAPTPQGQQTVADVNAETNAGAEQMVSVFWSMYNKLNVGAVYLAKIDEEDIMKREAKGEIDLSLTFTLPSQQPLTAKDYFKHYNQTVVESFVTNPKLEKDTREAMIRLCKKYNLIMSDEWFVAMKVGEDLVSKAGQVLMLRKTSRAVLEQLVSMQKDKIKMSKEMELQQQNATEERMAMRYKQQFQSDIDSYFNTKSEDLKKEWQTTEYENIKKKVQDDLNKAHQAQVIAEREKAEKEKLEAGNKLSEDNKKSDKKTGGKK